MKIFSVGLITLINFLMPYPLFAEEENRWEVTTALNVYKLADVTYLNPVLSAQKNSLYLELRYNYEDLNTGSIFAGFQFHSGDTLELDFTPVIGLVFGNSDGIAPGFLLELNYWKMNFSSENEYFISSDDKESNFFYSWSELTYSPADWVWFGVAGQRTRAYETDLEIQRGLAVGVGNDYFSINGYWMNPGLDDAFGLISAEYYF